ncbi:MAG TPA: hybrid sensor histidine kinase/response regulator [Bryobacteraceae bacterium]|nr:hybrid sensor histidine kinase/response regulator [Bryobacteraceae bacterium]
MTQADIMIVDDNPANLKLLENMLSQQGHEIHSFPRGRLALAAAARHPPDLILLDINMPEINGYEVCERLKSDATLSAVPVIFLSALNETQDKVRAFRSGAVDYISKPFQFEEVQARVETHLKVHGLQQRLRMQNEHLEEAVAERTRELSQANARLRMLDESKTEFLRLISHELRTPLNGVLGAAELILEDASDSPENEQLRGIFDSSRRRLMAMLDDALLLAQIEVKGEHFRLLPVALNALLNRAIAKVAPIAIAQGVALAPAPPLPDVVLADEQLLERALQALLETAVKFSAEGESIRISREAGSGLVKLVVETRGRSIPAPLLPKFFDLFAVSEISTSAGDVGMGPAVASRILNLFGASAAVENLRPTGLRLAVALDRASAN